MVEFVRGEPILPLPGLMYYLVLPPGLGASDCFSHLDGRMDGWTDGWMDGWVWYASTSTAGEGMQV